MAFAISALTGRARLWGTPACSSFLAFSEELRKVFGPVPLGPDVTGGLMTLKQGSRSVADYAIDFRTQAASVTGTLLPSAMPISVDFPHTLRMS